tara:strand:- start:922 stop:1659 length:738 start_codon:yes stop_codon:yes gene_type:complete
MSFFSAGCDKKTDPESHRTKVIIATSADNPPFTFYDTSEGKHVIRGYEVDLANLIAKELNIEISFQDMDFSAIMPALQSGRADFAMALMTPTPERLKAADFSRVYSQSSPCLLLNEQKEIASDKDLARMRIGVQIASAHLELIKEISETVDGIQIVILNRVGELVQELKANRLDGVLVEETVADSFLKTTPDLYKALLKAHAVKGAAAFPKGSKWRQKVDEILKRFEESGVLDTLKKKWLASNDT